MTMSEDPNARYERNVEQLRQRLQGYRDAGVRPATVQSSDPGPPFLADGPTGARRSTKTTGTR